jgi:anti-sigma factor RsiW
MKHEFAIATHAVERYVLGEMSSEERDAFEEHYFACGECADDVRATSQFAGTATAVFHEDAEAPRKASLLDWLQIKWLSPALATAAFAAIAVIVFQNSVTIPALNAPRALPALALDLTSRAAAPRLGPGDPLHFFIAPERATGTEMVWAELAADSGRVLRSGAVAAPKPQQPVDVYFPGSVSPGHYVITIRSYQGGSPGDLIAKQAFEVTKDQTN